MAVLSKKGLRESLKEPSKQIVGAFIISCLVVPICSLSNLFVSEFVGLLQKGSHRDTHDSF